MACACPSQYGFGQANASTYDAQYAASNYSAQSQWAVVVYRAAGEADLICATILATTNYGSTVIAPGYPSFFIPTADVHYISQTQFNTGFDDGDARVFPIRCPDGSGSGLVFAEQTQTLNCSCVGAKDSFGCSCGGEACQCSGGDCSCPSLSNPNFEVALAAQIGALVETCTCAYFTQQPVQVASYQASSGVAGPNWTATAYGASYIQLNLLRDTRITGVFIIITSAGVPIPSGGSLPVRLILDAFDGSKWVRLLSATSESSIRLDAS